MGALGSLRSRGVRVARPRFEVVVEISDAARWYACSQQNVARAVYRDRVTRAEASLDAAVKLRVIAV